MGVFKKKPDPISERAKTLSHQIEALEEEIRRLSSRPAPDRTDGNRPAKAIPTSAAPTESKKTTAPNSQPKLRSTALPRSTGAGPNLFNSGAPMNSPVHHPMVDVADQAPLQQEPEADSPEHFNALGVRKYNLHAAWTRFKTNFRGPMASNPKLVNYLAAGSIQGLRPLRYEKRVARNRFLVFVAVLVLVLWGLIWLFVARR
jgi:hypothetical protein